MPNQTNSGDHQTKAIYDSQPIIKGNTTDQLINLLAFKLGGSTKKEEEYRYQHVTYKYARIYKKRFISGVILNVFEGLKITVGFST